MTVHERTIAKIQQLPESLAQEVSDFIDFLLVKQDSQRCRILGHLDGTYMEEIAGALRTILGL
jgi:hypothetical protein